jgi:hypothetical protein
MLYVEMSTFPEKLKLGKVPGKVPRKVGKVGKISEKLKIRVPPYHFLG